jgi:asparagine synthetase B (glutamine-hydrolysing)
VAITFSGGLDCTVLAILSDEFIPEGQAIDLINVAFENPRVLASSSGSSKVGIKKKKREDTSYVGSNEETGLADKTYDTPDRLTAREAWEELKSLRPKRKWNLVEVNVTYKEVLEHKGIIRELIRPKETVMDLASRE